MSSTFALVRIDITGESATVRAPIWAATTIRTMPVARWSPNDRAWTIPAAHVTEMRARLEWAGYTVRVIRPDAPRPPLRLPGGPRRDDHTTEGEL